MRIYRRRLEMVTSKSEKMNAKNRERELVKKTQKNKAEVKFKFGS